MPTITGSRQGGTTGPYLTLQWDVLQTDVANNRSRVRLILYLNASHRIKFSASKSGSLQGSGFSYTSGANGTGSWELRRQEVWVNHNSDGSKTQNFSGSFNIAISYSGTNISSLSVSGNATLPVIPRASTLTAFSFGAQLKNGAANSIKYTVDRKSGNFRHQIQLRDGNTTVWTWDNQNTNGENTIPLTGGDVNNLLNRMSTVTSKTFTLRVATRSGVSGGWIGSAVTRNATATIDDSVKPTVSAVTVSQTGNSVTTHYLQGKSKIKASFTRSAGYGATITNSSIMVRRKTTNNDVQTINSNSGTTGKTVSLSGTYEAQGMAKDSRGRTTYTAWAEFTVTAYTSPIITTFTAVRNASTPTTVNITRAGTHTHLGGKNILTYTVQRRIGTGEWTNVTTKATGTDTTGSFSDISTSTGNSVTSSYEFRLVVTDKFNERAESIITVSTQRVVLDIHKNEGVGIGKVHERGVLDVDGQAHFRGNIIAQIDTDGDAYRMISDVIDGHGYLSYYGSDGIRKAWVGFGNRTGVYSKRFNITNEQNGLINFETGGGVTINGDAIASRGSNSNGDWVRLYDGTQICWKNGHGLTSTSTTIQYGSVWRSGHNSWTFPQSFAPWPVAYGTANNNFALWVTTDNLSKTSVNYVIWSGANNNTTYTLNVMAIGRWK